VTIGPDELVDIIDTTAEAILDAARLDGLPLMGKLWTLTPQGDDILLRIRAVNNRPVPRQPPPPPAKPQPKPAKQPPPPSKPGGT
jgi:hypothetical protein